MQKASMTLIVLIVMITLVLPANGQTIAEEETPSLLMPAVDLRAGYSGTMWTPKNLEPFEVNSYGRNLFYGEVSILHPLAFLGEAFDIFNVPHLRIETNMGYSEESGSLNDLMPSSARENPYWRASGWTTFFDFVSFRYNVEKFDVHLIDARASFGEVSDNTFARTENRIREIEIGIVGSPDGEIHETMVEIGYYRSTMNWPVVKYREEFGKVVTPYITQQEFEVEGLYGALNTDPIPRIWPIRTQFMVRLGNTFGIDLRFNREITIKDRLDVGLALSASWRFIQSGFDEYDDKVEFDVKPSDTRYKLHLYTKFRLF